MKNSVCKSKCFETYLSSGISYKTRANKNFGCIDFLAMLNSNINRHIARLEISISRRFWVLKINHVLVFE